MTGTLADVHVLRVTLQHVHPPVWRRVAVPSSSTLGMLDAVVQAAFGWDGGHLHDFAVRGVRYTPNFGGPSFGEGARDEDAVTLSRVAPRRGDVLAYTYDFGDDWRHRLEVESVGPADADQQYPACLAGTGLAPEEDTGETRRGSFNEDARRRLNTRLRRLGTVGRELVRPLTPADPHFTGLFPELLVEGEGECPCGCGETLDASTLDASTLPDLPALRMAAEVDLAAAAAASPLVAQALALTAWVGAGRPLTPSRLLRPADAVRAVEELDLGTPLLTSPGTLAPPPGEGAGRYIKSAKDLPSLHPLWGGCLAADLIEIRGGKAYPGAGLATWQTADDPAASIETWCALVGGYLRTCDDTAAAARDYASQIRRQVLQQSVPLLYVVAQEPIPAAALAGAMAELDDDFGLPAVRLPVLFAEVEGMLERWLLAGVLQPAPEPPHLPEDLEDRIAELRAERFAQALLQAPALQLTELGAYTLARLLIAHDWPIPRLGDCLDAGPDDLLDRLSRYVPLDIAEEAASWLEAQGDAWAPALQRVVRSAAGPDDQDTTRRTLLPVVLGVAGPRATAIMDAESSDPWLAPVLAVTRHGLGLGPAPSMDQALWLTVDLLGVVLEDPEEFTALLEDSGLENLLVEPSALTVALSLKHPRARAVLEATASLSSVPEVRRSLRQALAGRSGCPASGHRPFSECSC